MPPLLRISPSCLTHLESQINMSLNNIKRLFLVAGLYDLLIGLVFLLRGSALLDWAGIPQPNHMGYLQFAALQLVIFGAMFLSVSRDPIKNRNLIPYGMMLKICYIGLTCFYWVQGECPKLFQPFTVIDTVMLVLFWLAYSGQTKTGTNDGE